MGLGTTGWGFSKTDGVAVGLDESNGVASKVNGIDFQWGCYRG